MILAAALAALGIFAYLRLGMAFLARFGGKAHVPMILWKKLDGLVATGILVVWPFVLVIGTTLFLVSQLKRTPK